MLHNADGVNGLLRRSKLSFVTWAFKSFAESRRTCRGFGGLAGILDVDESPDREVRNWVINAREDVVRSRRVCISGFDDGLFADAILSPTVASDERSFSY